MATGRRRSWSVGVALVMFVITLTTTGCPGTSGTPTSTTTTTMASGTSIGVWALGDSQGANSNDPNRGLPWTQRIGADVGNGADNMYGAGWTVTGTFTNLTVPQRAAALATSNSVTRYIVMAGVNDLTAGKSVAAMNDATAAFATFADAIGAQVTWVGVVPFPQYATIANRDADRRSFNQTLQSRYGSAYVDCGPAMSTSAGWLKPEYSLSSIDLHLNAAGEQALADCILAAG